jgi:glycosyltransferase involved in cell wall biosynthesis
LPLYSAISERAPADVIYSRDNEDFGTVVPAPSQRLRFLEVATLRPFGSRIGMFQRGLGGYLRRERPRAVLIFANPRYLSLWWTLAVGRLFGIPVHPHGHGLYKKPRPSPAYKLMMRLLLALASSYVCYTPSVRASFLRHGLPPGKLKIAENSVENLVPVVPGTKTGEERGMLFIGRLRPGNGLEMLIRVIEGLRSANAPEIELHVVGHGADQPALEQAAKSRPWLHIHGELYQASAIAEVSRGCFAGCYPGNAGLSVLHLMSLSLPPIAHGAMHLHQGPEPGYIEDGVNGLLFDHSDPERSLEETIHKLLSDSAQLRKMQQAAYQTYAALTTPPLADRLLKALECC